VVLALHIAAIHGNVAIAELLIDSNACVDETSFSGLTPLIICAQKGHQSVMVRFYALFNNNNTPIYFTRVMPHTELKNKI